MSHTTYVMCVRCTCWSSVYWADVSLKVEPKSPFPVDKTKVYYTHATNFERNDTSHTTTGHNANIRRAGERATERKLRWAGSTITDFIIIRIYASAHELWI